MQIDFHHGVTYVLARLAGFSAAEASVVAHHQEVLPAPTTYCSTRDHVNLPRLE